MKIGIVFPQTEFNGDPAAIRDFVQTAEDLGYTHILAYDHILGANPVRPGGWSGPYTHRDPFYEPFLLFSYMAALTHTLEFVTGIIILPQRETVLAAKQAATLDVLCDGRLRLGVATGWNKVEYVAMNQDFHTRGKRLDAQVALMRRLWTEPLVTVDDGWHHIDDAGINPLPVQ
ncbi:MAG: LLM class flavin-dependent oxidoreductase, partial [Caldilineaceae bacterium]